MRKIRKQPVPATVLVPWHVSFTTEMVDFVLFCHKRPFPSGRWPVSWCIKRNLFFFSLNQESEPNSYA